MVRLAATVLCCGTPGTVGKKSATTLGGRMLLCWQLVQWLVPNGNFARPTVRALRSKRALYLTSRGAGERDGRMRRKSTCCVFAVRIGEMSGSIARCEAELTLA